MKSQANETTQVVSNQQPEAAPNIPTANQPKATQKDTPSAQSSKTFQTKASGNTTAELIANARKQVLDNAGIQNAKVNVKKNNIHKTSNGTYEGLVTVTVQPQ